MSKDEYYKVVLDRSVYPIEQEIYKWCSQQFGVDSLRWNYDIVFGYPHYYFKNEEDAVWFTMKWVSGTQE